MLDLIEIALIEWLCQEVAPHMQGAFLQGLIRLRGGIGHSYTGGGPYLQRKELCSISATVDLDREVQVLE